MTELVPIIEREPPRGRFWGPEVLDLSGLDMMRASVEGKLPDAPIMKLTGIRLTQVGMGMASAAMPASVWWQSGAGVFLSGTIAFVADLPLACAVFTTAPQGVAVTSSELSVSFVRPATMRAGSIIGRARLIHSTRSLGLAEATIEDAHGRLLGHATSRCILFRPDRGSMRPMQNDTRTSALPDPYLRDVEGDVFGQDFWDSTAGIDVMRRTAAGRFRPPVFVFLGLDMPKGEEGDVTITMPASPWLCNAFGIVYGGAIALLADAAMTLSVGSTVPAATAYSPLDLKIHFLRPVPAGTQRLAARARVTHRGRTVAVVACEITDSAGRVIAQASGSLLILPGRPWERPVHVADEFPSGAE